MASKFNVYDFIANIIPGITFLWAIEQGFKAVGANSPFPIAGQLTETSVLIVLGYVCGLMLQGVSEALTEKKILLRAWQGFPSERMLLPNDQTFSAERKQEILRLIRERFKVTTQPVISEGASAEREESARRKKNQELFYLCYGYVENLNPKILAFDAQYGLFRCLLTTFTLLFIAAIPVASVAWGGPLLNNWELIMWPVVLSVCGWISYLRCRKRSKDFARAVYDLFTSGVAAPHKHG